MFVKSKTSRQVDLHRTHVRDGVFAAAVVFTVAYRLDASGASGAEPKAPAPPSEWASATKSALWHGASVTVAGTVRRAHTASDAVKVQLRVADILRVLQVSGERHWMRQGRTLVASAPVPWESLALSWSLAFGGTCDIPPGPLGPGRLPHPGGRCPYPWNPGGQGFYLREVDAEGQPLPRIEWHNDFVRSPMDRSRPGGFSPCAELAGLRLPVDPHQEGREPVEPDIKEMLTGNHVAPRELIFDRAQAGAEIEVRSMSTEPLFLLVPPCPVRVAVRRGKSGAEVPAAVRAIHIDADERLAWITFGHMFSYETPPSWVDVGEA